MAQAAEWVVVVDKTSHRQLEVCKAVRPSTLRGAVDCDDLDNAHADVCREVASFPAFCHVPTNQCVYGTRDTPEALESLATLAQTNQSSSRAPSTDTTWTS